jgi:hypothetical protein
MTPRAAALAAFLAVLVLAAAFAGEAHARALVGTSAADVLRGTNGSDTIRGTRGDDKIYGMGGNDRLYGGAGDDLIVGGPGRDVIRGGPGNDRIRSRDGTRDVVRCGAGRDRVISDPFDKLVGCEVRPVFRVNREWVCRGRVDLDLVKVTMKNRNRDAIYLREGCTGRIGRIEVKTWTGDGVKINVPSPVAHDLVIAGGYIRCKGNVGGHQDGVQAMAGRRITFKKLEINCNSRPNAQFYPSAMQGSSEIPTDVVCVRCFLGHGAAHTLFVHRSLRSGARDSRICTARFPRLTIDIDPAAIDPVNRNNRILGSNHRLCR